MAHFLAYRVKDQPWQEKELPEGEHLIGRDASAWLPLPHSSVSSRHAKIRLASGRVEIMDLGSTNGSKLEDTALPAREWTALAAGRTVHLGCASLIVKQPVFAESAADAAGRGGAANTVRLPSEGRVVDLVPPPTLREQSSGPVLIVEIQIEGSGWQRRVFSTFPVGIGRTANCDLPIPHPKVSRLHAVFEAAGGDICLVDQGSTNGSYVNGVRLAAGTRQVVTEADEIRIGPALLRASRPSVEECPPTVAVPGLESSEPGEQGTAPTRLSLPVEDAASADMPQRPLHLAARERTSIGRAADNNLVLHHPMVSRYHAVVERVGGRFRIQDLRTPHGVFVNQERVDGQAWLREGDVLQIGPYQFALTADGLHSRTQTGFTLRAEGIRKEVSRTLNLLQDLHLEFRPREFVALVGMSGAGKTTLLDALSGYRPATHGLVTVNGVDLYRHFDLFRTEIGYVPQRDIVHPELSPRLALDYAARLRMPPDTSSAERSALVTDVLADLDLSERQHVPIARLSGGQIKRVSIGVELLTKPRLFFLDEPTSGLDPGTENEMMRLLRRLADQGRTVLLVTHATKNVMLCDKVVFMARGGYLAFFGLPDKALAYFDSFRTDRERREKEMEFDDIYRILNDPERGSPAQWAERFRAHQAADQLPAAEARAAEAVASAASAQKGVRPARVSSLRQFFILSERNLRILVRDRVSLLLMLLLAPGLGLLDFVWGAHTYHPVLGDAVRTMSIWFMMSIISILVGSLGSVREIVKEADVCKRERTVGVRILPYVLSKIWVGVVLSIYQGGVLLFFRLWLIQPALGHPDALGALFATVVLGTLCGYLLGLAISALAPNQNASMLLLIAAVVPQFLFAGVLLPLDNIPGGEWISRVIPTRWTFEAFVLSTGVGDVIVADPCWGLEKPLRQALTSDLKEACQCYGENIFRTCADFPGIRSPDFYGTAERAALAWDGPVKPEEPTTLPSPTSYPSPTAPSTPTAYKMKAGESVDDFMERRESQGDEYQDTRQAQLDRYRETAEGQSDVYVEDLKKQNRDYADTMEAYGDRKADWEKDRQKAISSAESMLTRIVDNYGMAFRGTVPMRWLALGGIMSGFFAIILLTQKRKDSV